MKTLVYLSFFFIYCSLNFIFAQDSNENQQVFKKISNLSDDTLKIQKLFELGYTLENTDTVLCKQVYNLALVTSRKIKSPLYECKSLINLGVLFKTNSKLEKAQYYYQKAYLVATRNDNQEYQTKALINLGNILFVKEDLESALNHYFDAAKVLESLGQHKTLSLTYGNITNVFKKQLLFRKAAEYAEKAIEAGLKSGDDRAIGLAYSMAATAFNDINQKEKSKSLSLKALSYLKNANQLASLQDVYQQLSYDYLDEKNYSKASDCIDSCLKISNKLASPRMKTFALILKSRLKRETNHYSEAINVISNAETFAKQDGSWEMLQLFYYEKYKLELAKGNYSEALKNYENSENFEDSLTKETTQKATLNLEKRFDSELKQAKIQNLEKENRIKVLELNQKQKQIWLVIGFALLALSISALVILNQKRKSQIAAAEKKIREQKIKELETEKQLVALNGIIQGEENERNRLGQDLHDGLGSLLSGVKLSLTSLKNGTYLSEEQANLFGYSIIQLDNAIQEMRRVAHNLMPATLVEFGLIEAVKSFTENLNEQSPIRIHFEYFNFNKRPNKDQELVAYRMIQEAVNNAIKHAKATQIIIQIAFVDSFLNITIEDNGVGFDPQKVEISRHAGLQNLKNRTDYLKGKIKIDSKPGNGTSIQIEFPIA